MPWRPLRLPQLRPTLTPLHLTPLRATGVLTALLGLAAALLQVPYIALGPGPTYNTLGSVDGTPLIMVTGHPTSSPAGHLDLTTVNVNSSLTMVEAVQGWFDRSERVVPREVYFPPGTSDAQVEAQSAAQMQSSQDNATTAALHELHIPVSVSVHAVTKGAPADGPLHVGDVVRSVDGTPVADATDLRRLVSGHRPGDVVRLSVLRAGTPTAVPLTTASAGSPARAVIGVEPENVYPFTIKISLKDVGGPSAGLMFALGIIAKLDQPALTGGAYVAGTGEIDAAGVVGPIGGISQKLLGARRKGATVFLTPAANCAEAVTDIPPGLRLVKVATLQDALAGLAALRSGGSPASC